MGTPILFDGGLKALSWPGGHVSQRPGSGLVLAITDQTIRRCTLDFILEPKQPVNVGIHMLFQIIT